MSPRLLDLFCCEGGAAMGYHRAGWDVVGVDLEAKYERRYPFTFFEYDALYGGARRDKHEARNVRHGGYVPSKRVQEKLLGIDWMTQYGLYQSVPPSYTEHVGALLLAHIEQEKAA